jgi:RNA polymerase sigma-70 factor (sigma-E family)
MPDQAHEGFEDSDQFARSRGPVMLRVARSLLRQPADAEDVVQDVLAKALRSWKRVVGADDPAAYVNRMLVNECTSFWRRPARREEPQSGGWPERINPDSSEQHALREQLLSVIRTLPGRQRAVIALRYLDDMSDQQIAEVLDLTVNAVRVNAHRGLARLRATLDQRGADVVLQR